MFPIQETWSWIVQRSNRIVPGAAEGVVGAHAVEARHVRVVQAGIFLDKDLRSAREEHPAIAEHGMAATEYVAGGRAGVSYREGCAIKYSSGIERDALVVVETPLV